MPLKDHLIEIGNVIAKENNDVGTMASYAQRETSELAEACLIHTNRIYHKDSADVNEVIGELADSFQSAFALACASLNLQPETIADLVEDAIGRKNRKWIDIIDEEKDEVNWDRLHSIAKQNHIKLVQVEEGDEIWNSLGQNDMYNVCFFSNNTLYMGVYDLATEKLLAFFVKLAHALNYDRVSGMSSGQTEFLQDRAYELMRTYSVPYEIPVPAAKINVLTFSHGPTHNLTIPISLSLPESIKEEEVDVTLYWPNGELYSDGEVKFHEGNRLSVTAGFKLGEKGYHKPDLGKQLGRVVISLKCDT